MGDYIAEHRLWAAAPEEALSDLLGLPGALNVETQHEIVVFLPQPTNFR